MSTVPVTEHKSTHAPASARLQHLQVLRVFAASFVVLDHTTGSLHPHGLSFPVLGLAGDAIGGLGVSVFFLISGLIMVRQSADRFGTRTYPFVFAVHRLIRIVPIYWIATSVWRWGLHGSRFPIPFDHRQFVLSLTFIPDYLSGQYRLNPILPIGWTLNYEMAFYLLFTLALFLPRRFGILALVAVIVAAAGWGATHFPPQTPTPLDLVRFYTDHVILLFAGGVMLGAFEILLPRPTPPRLPISPAFLMLVPAAIVLWHPGLTLHYNIYAWSGFFIALTIVALCTLTANQRPGWCTRALVLLGDASYSTYLFHLWVFSWTNVLVLRVYVGLHRVPASPFAFFAAAVVAANILGLAVHLLIERPITQALRKAIAYTFSGSGTFSPRSSTS